MRPGSYRIRWNNAKKSHCAVQSHSRSPILVPIESSYDFLLVISTNLSPVLHRYRDVAFDISKIALFGARASLLRLTTPMEGFPWDDLRKIFRGCQRMAKVPNDVENIFDRVRCTNVTQQTDGRATVYSKRERWFVQGVGSPFLSWGGGVWKNAVQSRHWVVGQMGHFFGWVTWIGACCHTMHHYSMNPVRLNETYTEVHSKYSQLIWWSLWIDIWAFS